MRHRIRIWGTGTAERGRWNRCDSRAQTSDHMFLSLTSPPPGQWPRHVRRVRRREHRRLLRPRGWQVDGADSQFGASRRGKVRRKRFLAPNLRHESRRPGAAGGPFHLYCLLTHRILEDGDTVGSADKANQADKVARGPTWRLSSPFSDRLLRSNPSTAKAQI